MKRGRKPAPLNYPCDGGCGRLLKPPYPSRIAKRFKHYCSRKCCGESQKRRKECICRFCHKQFETFSCRDGLFCSRECHKRYQRDSASRSELRLTCTFCGVTFSRKPHELAKAKRKGLSSRLCSLLCRDMFLMLGSSKKNMIYTPSLIQMMLGHRGTNCAFPGCYQPRESSHWSNPYNVCSAHRQRIYRALWVRRKKRITMLSSSEFVI